MKDTSTKFPNTIDDRLFAMDISIKQVPIMQEYYRYLEAGNYDRATELLNNSDVFFYGAWILNLLENRLCAIGDYVMQLEDNKGLLIYNSLEPSQLHNTYEGMNWVSDEILNELS